MDQQRAKTLEALSTFIESQRALLSQTHADIERLKALKDEVSRAPDVTPATVSQRLEQGAFRLNDSSDLATNIVKDIDWSLYKLQDAQPLRSLASETKRIQSERAQPSPFQRSELSDLQKLVKQSRKQIVDPVFALLASDPWYNLPLKEDAPLDPEEIRKELERDKIRELKKRKISCALTVPIRGDLRRVPMASGGVFIRRDQDESADVDVTMEEVAAEPMEVDPPPVPPQVVTPVSQKPVRAPRISRKAEPPPPPAKPKKELKQKPPKEERKPKRGGPKSDTYKLAWSVEEQHLLERLMQEIPDGERNRWAKISQAMDGRRTPRQVASRVQKYFEKLRKFGLDVEDSFE